MEKETMGTVISVTKQWWLKVNRKPVRAHAMDGAAFPHTIKVKYTIDGKDYICRKWIGAGNKVPDKGTTIKVTYCEDKPSKARIELSHFLRSKEKSSNRNTGRRALSMLWNTALSGLGNG